MMNRDCRLYLNLKKSVSRETFSCFMKLSAILRGVVLVRVIVAGHYWFPFAQQTATPSIVFFNNQLVSSILHFPPRPTTLLNNFFSPASSLHTSFAVSVVSQTRCSYEPRGTLGRCYILPSKQANRHPQHARILPSILLPCIFSLPEMETIPGFQMAKAKIIEFFFWESQYCFAWSGPRLS